MFRFLRSAALAALALVPGTAFAAAVDPDLLAGLDARQIGPATMSGRIADVEAVESNPDILYIGAAAGGVWKSVNGGLTWKPLFDDQPVASIGALAIDPSNPDVVWVGTGEANPRNSVSVGGGVYRTIDGGQTWKHLGLEETERIHQVVLHPNNPNVAWVAAMGRLWGENPERGVFKTVDGGKTWRKVLYVDERTGAADLIADPGNPNKLFAAMWDYRRWPWFFRSGGPGSGLYVTYDGGETWKRYTEEDGLPKGDLGRTGLAISRSNPNIVYALVEAEKSALLRSDDGGITWKKVNEDQRTAERPFYYADIEVDPQWPNRIYNLTARLMVSNDSGKSFELLGRSREVHGDYHAMWINPKDPDHIVTASDGGIAISHDRGETWQFASTLPLGQFYHVAVDMEQPYNVYGGLQDNGSWRGPNAVWGPGGLRNANWEAVGGGDGFDTRPDPRDSMTGYSMSQGGELVRWNLRTREQKPIKPPEPMPGSGLEPLRFNWNAGLGLDPFEPGTIYYGSQYVHKSTDGGDSWTVISPDLTTDNPEWQQQAKTGGLTPDATGAENFTTIVAIAPSPLQEGVIWVGTDDGRLHVTRDGGKSWTSVEKNVYQSGGVPANTWIPHILPSKHDAGSAFVVFDNHRRSDFKPYVYRTDDWGKTWKSLATKDIKGYALTIEQDPKDRDLLFLGTELGLFVSLDGGARWMPWRHGVPTTSVMDLVIHPRDLDLVIATHGRSVYVLDDITPLREISAETLAKPIHLYPIQPATLVRAQRFGGVRGGGAGEFQGENRPIGALLTFSLNAPGLPLPDDEKERERKEAERAAARQRAQTPTPGSTPRQEDPPAAPDPGADTGARDDKGPQAEIRITDASGKEIRTFKRPVTLGVNRVVWNLTRDPFRTPPTDSRGRPRGEDDGPPVPPGTYNVTVKYGKEEARGTVQVVADPQVKNTDADWQAREAAIQRMGELQNALTDAINRIGATRKDVEAVLAKLDAQDKERTQSGQTGDSPNNSPNRALRQSARDLQKKLSEVERRLYVPPTTKGIVVDETAASYLQRVGRALGSTWSAPSETTKTYMEHAERAVREALAAFNKLYAEDVAAFGRKVSEAKVGLLGEVGPIEVK